MGAPQRLAAIPAGQGCQMPLPGPLTTFLGVSNVWHEEIFNDHDLESYISKYQLYYKKWVYYFYSLE